MKSVIQERQPCVLALETGDVFVGYSIGAEGTSYGELIFNTSMSGYQEIITDPSYRRQIVTMTYPEIGNYGIHKNDNESSKIQSAGLVVKNYYPFEIEKKVNSEFTHSVISLSEFLKQHKTVAIAGVDTRKITGIIRKMGCVKAVISTEDFDHSSLVEKAKASAPIGDFDCIAEVMTKETYDYEISLEKTIVGSFQANNPFDKLEPFNKIVVLDYGVKTNILRLLKNLAKHVTVVPGYTTAEELLSHNPDGVLLSNGPGDPATFKKNGLKTVQELIGKVPLFGICFGHQVLMKALNETTYKLKFGHHAANHPIKDLKTGKVYVSSQNHGYAVGEHLKPEDGLTHLNLNDQTVAGYQNEKKFCFSVQYHPEASPGPHDSQYLFNDFYQLIKRFKAIQS